MAFQEEIEKEAAVHSKQYEAPGRESGSHGLNGLIRRTLDSSTPSPRLFTGAMPSHRKAMQEDAVEVRRAINSKDEAAHAFVSVGRGAGGGTVGSEFWNMFRSKRSPEETISLSFCAGLLTAATPANLSPSPDLMYEGSCLKGLEWTLGRMLSPTIPASDVIAGSLVALAADAFGSAAVPPRRRPLQIA